MIKISDGTINVETKTLKATIKDGKIISLAARSSGKVYIDDKNHASRAPLQLVYAGNDRDFYHVLPSVQPQRSSAAE